MDKQSWNAFVLHHSPGALFQSWEWGDVEKKLGKQVWRLSWPDGIAQIVKVPARRGTFLHVRHGPIGTVPFDELVDLAKREHALFIRISPQQSVRIPRLVSAPIHAMDAERCWVLDLNKSEDAILKDMRKSTRYEIKHGTATVTSSNDIDIFLSLYEETSKRHQFVEHRGIREEFETLDCELFIATHEKKVLAAAVIVYFGDQAIYHHGASIPNRIGASYLVQWKAICEAKRRGKKVYNFWGIAPEGNTNHPWAGLSSFKKGFGGRELLYPHAMDYPISPLYIIPKTIEDIRKKLKGY